MKKIKQGLVPGFLFILLLSGALLTQTACHKQSSSSPSGPTKFTQLQVSQGFKFNTYNDIDVTIDVSQTGAFKMFVIQLFNGNPANGGKLIGTGATDANSQYKTKIRMPSALTSVYIGKISADGSTVYVSAPISGNILNYSFTKSGGVKSMYGTEGVPDCSSGCTQTLSTGTYNNLNIASGAVVCVPQGTSVTLNTPVLNTGGTVRICGTVTWNNINGSGGTIMISATGTMNGNYALTGRVLNNYSTVYVMPNNNFDGTLNNYGTLNVASGGTFQINSSALVHNYGTMTVPSTFNVNGTLINDGPFSVNGTLTNNGNGIITNTCSLIVTGSNNFQNNGALTNNGYINVTGQFSTQGSATNTLGLQSLIQCNNFDIEGNITGPSQQGAQIKATGSGNSKTSGGCTISGYVDMCAPAGISPDNGNYGTHGTKCAYTIPVPNCSAPTSPAISSALTAGGMVSQSFTYTITATGTAPITFNATNLPAGLTFSGNTISGIPTTAATTNVTLTADNNFGTDTKTLVITIAPAGTPPTITSSLTATATAGQAFSYNITASGTAPITYSATGIPAGLTLNPSTGLISGAPSAAGTYTIPMTATNTYGHDTKNLVLTVSPAGNPPVITSALTASGTTTSQFTYNITASGTSPITYNATGLPAGLFFSGSTISGTPTNAGVSNITLTATNSFGNDSKILVLTVAQGLVAPVITSPLTASGVKNQSFSYTITASGSTPITYTATNLPAGLTFSGNTISGIPTASGNTNVNLTANNAAGTDNKVLVITITNPVIVDTDGDGVPDSQDAYPLDPTRAFNSYYPNQVDYGTVAFEDLWPSYGDYDMNDLVMNFNYKIVTNAQNQVVDIIVSYKIKAAGASMNNGFGIILNTPPANIASVTGCIKVGSAVTIDPKGYEAGHTNETVIIPVDAVNTLLGSGMVNTIHGGPTIQTSLQTVTVHFSNPQASIGTAPYNPFMFVNQERGKEIHLKDQSPSELVNQIYFGINDDASVPSQSKYYRSKTGLCWAIEIPIDWSYPQETIDIVQTHLHFADWAQSNGTTYQDWYVLQPGYQNVNNLY
jgi:LruC domain-containing protein